MATRRFRLVDASHSAGLRRAARRGGHPGFGWSGYCAELRSSTAPIPVSDGYLSRKPERRLTLHPACWKPARGVNPGRLRQRRTRCSDAGGVARAGYRARASEPALSFPPDSWRCSVLAAMAAPGHERRFALASLSAGYEFRKETIAGTHGNERDAPSAVIPALAPERGSSTQSRRSLPSIRMPARAPKPIFTVAPMMKHRCAPCRSVALRWEVGARLPAS